MFPRRPSHAADQAPGDRLSAVAVSLALSLAVFLTIAVSIAGGHPASQPSPSLQPAHAAERATNAFLALSGQYQAADPATRGQLLARLTSEAVAREQLLAATVEHDPGSVLRTALPVGLVQGLPASVLAHVEKFVALEGQLDVLHEDRADGDRYLYVLQTTAERLSLHFAADPPTLMTGSRVKVHGVRVGQALALDSGSTSVQTLAAAALPNTFGEQRTLVMLVTFSDNPVQPYTPDHARDMFNTTSQFDLENSFQQTWLQTEVVGWYTIALTSTVCDYSALASQARAAASAAGVTLSAYNRYVYAFPANACTWWGLGSVGGNPSTAWINGDLLLDVTAHEMGHNFGLYHSRALDCGTTTLGPTCTSIEYGDYIDVMGGYHAGHYNAFQKERLGWLNYGVSPPITTVLTSGTYTIEAYELAGSQPKALKILKSTDPVTGKRTWYYVEYRQPIGFDGFLANNTNIRNGVIIHTGSESTGNSSDLLDLTPATSTWSDPALVVGQSLNDPYAGVTITAAWATGTQAAVTVDFGPLTCLPANPTVAVSPAQSQSVVPGTPVTYTVSISNRDNAGCVPSTFDLQVSVPSGWTALFASSSLTVSPGATASTTVQVSAPLGTAAGLYTIGVSATNSSASTYTASNSATAVIASSLSLTVGTDRASYKRNQSVSMTAVASSAGSPVANAAVTFTVTKPNGAVSTRTATTSSDGAAVYKMRIGGKDAPGVYQVRADGSSGGTSAVATTTFTVQ
jgi:hypothetical protein